MEQFTSGYSVKRCNGTTGNNWPIAHESGSERKTLMLAWYQTAGCIEAFCVNGGDLPSESRRANENAVFCTDAYSVSFGSIFEPHDAQFE